MAHSQNDSHAATVLFVSLSGWQAGPGRSLVTLITHLPATIRVVLACPTAGDLLPAVQLAGRLEEHVALPRNGQEPDERSRLKAILILARWLVEHRHHVTAVHTNGFSELHIAAPGASVTRIPLVAWFLGHEENPWDARLGPVWRHTVRFNGLVAISDIARARAASAGVAPPERFELIPTPIDPDSVLVPASRRRRESTRPIVVGFFGGTTLHKGMNLLPELIRKVGKDVATWSIFSRPPDAREATTMDASWRQLHEFGDDWVSISDYAEDVRDAFAPCDVALSMSSAEAFGRTVAEAMLNGIPVVATDIAAHRSLLGNDEAGLLFPCGDLDRAAAAICLLAADADLRSRLGAIGRHRAASFSPTAIADRFANLYMRGSRHAR